jgi:hypothetical protein
MSHNITTVDNQNPDNTSNIPVNLSSYINETSVSNNQVIRYDGSNWVNGSNPSPDINAGVGVWFKNTASVSSSGSYSVNDYLMILKSSSYVHTYLASGYSLKNATSTNTIKSNSNWLEAVNISSAGKYLCICTLAIRSGDMKARWESNAGGFSSYVHVTVSNNDRGAVILGIVETTGADVIRVVVKEMNTTSSLISNDHRGLSIHILKLN